MFMVTKYVNTIYIKMSYTECPIYCMRACVYLYADTRAHTSTSVVCTSLWLMRSIWYG